MCTQQSDSVIWKALQSLCCNNGWSYGIFWRCDQRNSLLLTMQDAYYEEHMGPLIDDMVLQVHMLGGGIIGQAAFTKNHRWMFADSHYGELNTVGLSRDVFQDDSEFNCQFSFGIKAIAVISVELGGVVQFGSKQKILETMEFVSQTQKLFRKIQNDEGLNLSETAPSSSKSESYGSSGLFASLISSGNCYFPNLKPVDSACCQDFAGTACSSTNQSFSFTSDHRRATDLSTSSSFLNNRMQISDSHLQESLVQSTSQFNCSVDNFSQWFAPSVDTIANDDPLSQAFGFISSSPNLKGGNDLMEISANYPANSVQSSITNVFTSDGKESFFSNISGIESKPLDNFGLDFVFGQAGDWDNILVPVVNGGPMDFSTETSECISELQFGSPRKGLFSKLGIEQLLDGVSGTSNSLARSSLEDQLSSTTKRRRTESSLGNSDQVQLAGSSFFNGNTSPLQRQHNLDRTNYLGPKKEGVPKLEAGPWTGDSYSMNTGTSVSQTKKHVEPAKATKKKAKPGARPRPKDRQQIQDRVSELRELIPNGGKMSIDCLLDRTIKHMLFMQSVTKYADRLKQDDEPKENGLIQKGNSSSNGVTWACEFGDQTMVCPLIVEDLSTSGQMLIEMLCEEQGFFLEIADIIRGFALNILKGVMEVRESKIWAHFIVATEGNRHVTRHEIFSALVQLLQMAGTSEINVSDHLGHIIDGGTNLLSNYQQSVLPLPLSLLAECTRL